MIQYWLKGSLKSYKHKIEVEPRSDLVGLQVNIFVEFCRSQEISTLSVAEW